MGRVERFEDLIAWQKARELTREIYRVTRERAFARDLGLAGQIQRVAVLSHLYVALDSGYLDEQSFDALLARATEVYRILGGLRCHSPSPEHRIVQVKAPPCRPIYWWTLGDAEGN